MRNTYLCTGFVCGELTISHFDVWRALLACLNRQCSRSCAAGSRARVPTTLSATASRTPVQTPPPYRARTWGCITPLLWYSKCASLAHLDHVAIHHVRCVWWGCGRVVGRFRDPYAHTAWMHRPGERDVQLLTPRCQCWVWCPLARAVGRVGGGLGKPHLPVCKDVVV